MPHVLEFFGNKGDIAGLVFFYKLLDELHYWWWKGNELRREGKAESVERARERENQKKERTPNGGKVIT